MSALAWIVTILGLIATIVGSVLAFFSYVSPLFRLKHYLKKFNKWEKVYIGRFEEHWRYKSHPEFIIEVDDEGREWTTTEDWMTHYPDSSKFVHLVKVKVNGQVLLVEDFISLDGGRYLVPVPRREFMNSDEMENGEEAVINYWYDDIQVDLARIVGHYYHEKTLEAFMSRHNLVAM